MITGRELDITQKSPNYLLSLLLKESLQIRNKTILSLYFNMNYTEFFDDQLHCQYLIFFTFLCIRIPTKRDHSICTINSTNYQPFLFVKGNCDQPISSEFFWQTIFSSVFNTKNIKNIWLKVSYRDHSFTLLESGFERKLWPMTSLNTWSSCLALI